MLRKGEIQRKLIENSAKIREHSKYLRRGRRTTRAFTAATLHNQIFKPNSVEVRSQYQIRPQPPPVAIKDTKTYCVDNLSFSDCASSFHEGRELAYNLRMQLETNTLDEISLLSTQESTLTGMLDVPRSSNTPQTRASMFTDFEDTSRPLKSYDSSDEPSRVVTEESQVTAEEDSLQLRPAATSLLPDNVSTTQANSDVSTDGAEHHEKNRISPRQTAQNNAPGARALTLQTKAGEPSRPIRTTNPIRHEQVPLRPTKPQRVGLSVIRKVSKEHVEREARRERARRRRQYNDIVRARQRAVVKAPRAILPPVTQTDKTRTLHSAVRLIDQEESCLYKDLQHIDEKLASMKLSILQSAQENTNLNQMLPLPHHPR